MNSWICYIIWVNASFQTLLQNITSCSHTGPLQLERQVWVSIHKSCSNCQVENLVNGRCCVMQDASNTNIQADPLCSPQSGQPPILWLSFLGCKSTRPQHDSILPLLRFAGNLGWEEKKTTIRNNHSAQDKQRVVEASASLSLSLSAMATLTLICRYAHHLYSAALWGCWLSGEAESVKLNCTFSITVCVVSLLSTVMEGRLCAGARDYTLRKKPAQLLSSCKTKQPADWKSSSVPPWWSSAGSPPLPARLLFFTQTLHS